MRHTRAGYAGKSLALDIEGTVNIPMRYATRTDYKKSIFAHLNFKAFNASKTVFHHRLEQKMSAGMLIPEKLVPEAEEFLISSKVALPTRYYLKREINAFCSHQQDKIFGGVHQPLSETLINRINATLDIIPGEDVTWSQKFKEHPASASVSLLQDYLQRYQETKR